eukprot:TRINITY_DN5245_c0_g1_i1.p1 TRINITY_DN5245_c0_g1~~TRINITY_DN5245_c0_g1_i1.p1  ORF type:complete len:1290 (+),score=243.20 TRINITY_DN5245_c0_g1_i1:78-3872(+)
MNIQLLARNKFLIVGLVGLLLVLLSKRGKKTSRRVGNEKDSKRGSRSSGDKGAVGAIWRMLCPKLTKFEMEGGGWQLFGILVLSLLRIGIMNKTSRIVQALDKNAMTRNQDEFWKFWKQQLYMGIVACFHRQTYKYVENSLAVSWREKITHLIHKNYFKNKNYYTLAQKGAHGTSERNAITDPDERICEDAKDVATQLAHVFCEGIYASTAGTFFAFKLGQFYGIQYALAPYLYLWTMVVLTKTVAPMRIGKWISETKSLFASYTQAHTALTTNQEAVAALGGAEFEQKTLQDRFKAAIRKARQFHKAVMWPTLVEQLAFSWLLRSFMASFIIAPHALFRKGKLDLTNLKAIAKLKGDIGYQFVLFVQSMIAAGTTAKILKQLDRISGSAIRVNRLTSFINSSTTEEHDDVLHGDCIKFSNVDIYTPSPDNSNGTLLVKDLSFTLSKDSSLLLTGHNGAGKSSIFRCLGGLWKSQSGSITKPGSGDGLHERGGVYYLPQKPYNVNGTLAEQLCYPEDIGVLTSEKELMLSKILEKVDLGYLQDRFGCDTVVNWDAVLSLGEMQRLAIARLLYHEPAFAILDECTSSVSGEMEARLYEHVLKDTNTAYITISHRPALRAYHKQMLTIGLGDGKYLLQDLNKEDHMNEISRTHVHQSDNSHKKELTGKGAVCITTPKSKKVPSDMIKSLSGAEAQNQASLTAFVNLVRAGLPKGKSTRLLAITMAVIAQIGCKVQSTKLMSSMMSSVFQQDKKYLLKLIAQSVGMSFAGAFAEQVVAYLQHDTSEAMIEGLTASFTKRYLRNKNYYKMVQIDGLVTDPQQRLTTDLREFTNTTAAMIPNFVTPVLEISWYGYLIANMIDVQSVGKMGLYMVFATAAIRLSMPSFRRIIAKESELESLFKTSHSRVKHHSESIAFYGGGSREEELVNKRFSSLMVHSQKRLHESWKFDIVNGAVIREAPFCVQWLLRNEYSRRVSDASVVSDGGVELGRAQAFIFDSTEKIFTSMGELLKFAENLERIYGLVHRLTEFDEAMTRVEATGSSTSNHIVSPTGSIALSNVDVVTPTGANLVRSLSLSIDQNNSLMITGRNAIGKTSLFRVLSGLWPCPVGTVALPQNSNDVFLVPQQVFMVLGSLADQITYPERLSMPLTEEKTSELLSLLTLVGIPYLVDRHGWEDTSKQWVYILSLGEQQRIGMARLFYHKPKFGILDECTSAVSIDVENKLYSEAKKCGITAVTISQRLALTEFHSQELNLSEEHQNGWKLTKLSE